MSTATGLSSNQITATKLDQSKSVFVKSHHRVIYCREYYFICQQCDRDVCRQTFGSCPTYCADCRPPRVSVSDSQAHREAAKSQVKSHQKSRSRRHNSPRESYQLPLVHST